MRRAGAAAGRGIPGHPTLSRRAPAGNTLRTLGQAGERPVPAPCWGKAPPGTLCPAASRGWELQPLGAQPVVRGVLRGGCPRPHPLSLPAGWKLNPVVGAVYGPEFYAGNVRSGLSPLRVPPECQFHTVFDPTAARAAPSPSAHAAPLCAQLSPPCPLAPASPSIPTRQGVEAALAAGVPAMHPRLSLPSCSNGVPVPCHGHGCRLPRGTSTGTRTRRLQHLPGCAAATTHPHLRRVSTRAAGAQPALGRGVVGCRVAPVLPPLVLALPGSCTLGTGCSSPSTCLASGSVGPPQAAAPRGGPRAGQPPVPQSMGRLLFQPRHLV